MSKAVEFLNENPVQYLATVGRDGKAKCRPFMFAGEVDGKLCSAPTTQKMFTKICRRIRKSKSLFPTRPTHGSVCTEPQCLKIT